MLPRIQQRSFLKTINQVSTQASRVKDLLEQGVPLEEVQNLAGHADPRTTMRYDRARVSLDRHATYIVATFIAGAAR